MADSNFKKVLDLSTAHISEETAKWLSTWMRYKNREQKPFRYVNHQHGYIIFLGDHVPAIPAPHKELYDIMQLALDNDCSLINLDQDGGRIEGLETFNW